MGLRNIVVLSSWHLNDTDDRILPWTFESITISYAKGLEFRHIFSGQSAEFTADRMQARLQPNIQSQAHLSPSECLGGMHILGM